MFARSYGQTPGIIQGQMDRGPQGSFGAPANDLGGFGMPAPMEQPQTFPAPSQPMNNLRPQAQRPNQSRYDKFAEAMMNARGGRRGMGGMQKPMGPRPGMSPPLIPGGGQSMGGQMQAKPAMQPGAPILTNGPGIY